jgi:C1A family cysteine protease
MIATTKLGKGLGRKPDRPDERDFRLTIDDSRFFQSAISDRPAGAGSIQAPLPSSIDVFAGLDLPVYDQGELGSCTADAGVLYRRFLAQRFAKYSAPDQDLSRLFLYYQERKLPWNNDVATDSGASVRDTMYVLAHVGVCPDADDPYALTEFASEAANDNSHDLSDAAAYKIGAYHRVPDVDTARSCLASGYAIELGFTVYESFESIGADGVMPMPQPGEQVLGGHAVVIRGYDDVGAIHESPLQGGAFLCQSSWGPEWGEGGCLWMPYAFLENAAISQPDMWMAHLGRPWRA